MASASAKASVRGVASVTVASSAPDGRLYRLDAVVGLLFRYDLLRKEIAALAYLFRKGGIGPFGVVLRGICLGSLYGNPVSFACIRHSGRPECRDADNASYCGRYSSQAGTPSHGNAARRHSPRTPCPLWLREARYRSGRMPCSRMRRPSSPYLSPSLPEARTSTLRPTSGVKGVLVSFFAVAAVSILSGPKSMCGVKGIVTSTTSLFFHLRAGIVTYELGR